jgi:DNA-binding protein H-NS
MSNFSVHDLLAQKAELEQRQAEIERAIQQAQREERNQAIAKVKELMAAYGLTLADLGTRAAAAPRKAARNGSKVAPKYRHPATGETWTGRGLKPKWLRAELEAGRTIDSFLIPAG